jgi:5-methylcytosine-specific restriction endonuclease McrA
MFNERDREDPKYKAWRFGIFKRDEFCCQSCYKKGVKLQAHHIKRWADFPELRYLQSNGITLCEDCHKQVNGNEEAFELDFKKKIEQKKIYEQGLKVKKNKESRSLWTKWRPRDPRLRF